jgi:hypothetical protein
VKRIYLSLPFAWFLSACDDRAMPTPTSDRAPGPALSPSASAPAPGPTAPPTPSTSAAPEKVALSILKLTFTSAVKDKAPANELNAAGPGQRVWVHLTVRNRTGGAKRVSLIFRVGGEERSTVDLTIEPSWSFRSWGYNTLRASDTSGELTVDVREAGGPALASARLPIRSSTKTAGDAD